MAKKFYVVWQGRHPGVYDDWSDAEEQVVDFPGAHYKAFDSPEEAAIAFRKGSAKDDLKALGRVLAKAMEKEAQPAPATPATPGAWAVDASCLGNPGVMEYRGVDLSSGKEIFRVGPFQQGTNNIGEFLAIVHAAALQQQQGITRTIYTDSATALSWIRNRGPRTKLKETPANKPLFQLLARATKWLATHTIHCPVQKWPTKEWGEIPADFGRK